MSESELLRKKLEREQRARREAESLLEAKSRELYRANEELRRLNESLEEQVQHRTDALTEATRRSQLESAERKRAEQRFRATIESAPTAIVMIDSTGSIVLANAEAVRMFQYERNELLGRAVEILIPARFRRQHPQLRSTFFDDPQPRRMGVGRDLYGLRKDGQEFPIEIGLNPVETDEGIFVLSAIVDITERKRAEQRFRATVESAPTAMVMIDRAGSIVLANAEALRMFQYELNELLGRTVEILIPARFQGQHPQLRSTFFDNPQPRRMGVGRDLYGLRKDGQEFPIEIGLNPVETEEGIFVLSAIVDITERKGAQAALDETRRELLDLAENSNVCMHWVNREGIIEWVNQAELNLLGYSPEEYVGRPIATFHVDPEVIEDILKRLGSNQDLSGYEARLRAKDGTIKTVSIHSSVYFRDGEFKHTRCFTTDITEKKLAEQRLARQAREATLLHRVTAIAAKSESFEAALEGTVKAICQTVEWPVGHVFWKSRTGGSELVSARIWSLPDDSRFEVFREATEGCCFQSGVGLPGRVMASASPAWIKDVATDPNYPRNQILTDLPVRSAFAFPIVLHGETLTVLEFYTGETVSPDEGLLNLSTNIGTQLSQAIERIDSRTELEEHTRQLERSNRELQEFAYVASHDLRSPLRAVLHLSEWVIDDDDNRLSDQSREDLASLQTRARAMSRLLDDLLAYSRVGRKAYESVEINTGDLIAEIVASLDKPIAFEVCIADRMPTLIAPLVPLRLVLQNLIENAIKHHHRPDGRVDISGHEDHNFIHFKVEDDGPGIPSDAIRKVFEIFVTLGTSEASDASGMGLALVKKTVETHGGSVRIEIPPGEGGVIFHVHWPKTPPRPNHSSAATSGSR